MRMMKFLRVWLLSDRERRALEVNFDKTVTVIWGRNGFGKSALLKSLYNAFGAEPHRIDDSWRRGHVMTAVDFEIDGVDHTILKVGSTFTVFDGQGRRLHQAASIMDDFAPYMANLLDFRLVMPNQQDEIVVPPPAYAFVPFYVDQDRSWSRPWESFDRLFLPKSAESLAEYHLGLKPNAYYIALAERNRIDKQIEEAEDRLNGLRAAVGHLRAIQADTQVYFDLDDYKAETDRLLDEARALRDRQSAHRQKLTALEDERSLWSSQFAVTQAALAEAQTVYASAIEHPEEVICPTCGEHYQNDIALRFHLSADVSALMEVHQSAGVKVGEFTEAITKLKDDLGSISSAITRVHSILSIRKEDLSLGEILAAEGRNAAARVLREQIGAIDGELAGLSVRRGKAADDMRRSQDRNRSQAIRSSFAERLVRFASELDVRVGDVQRGAFWRLNFARGSEGPRGLAAYYYAVLHTIRQFGSSTFCPIVIDAPNQQGQDAAHLPAMIKFLTEKRPEGSQLILGVEDPVGLSQDQAALLEVGVRRNQLLSETQYQQVAERLRPYIAQMV